jgi:hypothetical protein
MSHRLQFREAEHGRTERMEKYKDLPSPFKEFQLPLLTPESNTAGSEVVPVSSWSLIGKYDTFSYVLALRVPSS